MSIESFCADCPRRAAQMEAIISQQTIDGMTNPHMGSLPSIGIDIDALPIDTDCAGPNVSETPRTGIVGKFLGPKVVRTCIKSPVSR